MPTDQHQQSFLRALLARTVRASDPAERSQGRPRRWFLQGTAVGAAMLLLLTDAVSDLPTDTGMPRLTPVSAADVETPDQADGTAAGRSHESGSALDDGDASGNGADVDPPDGALPQEWADLPEDAEVPPPPEPEDEAALAAAPESEPEVTGFDADTSEELVEERDEHSRTYENEDGTRATDFSLDPLHFEDDGGDWEEIDTSLVQEGGDAPRALGNTETWTNAADSSDIDFAALADAPELARMELDGDGEYGLSFSLEGAQSAQGRVPEDEENTILYEDALPGVDIELNSLVGGVVKETIWLNEPPESEEDTVWRFPLELDGLEPVLAEDGGVDLVDDGETIAYIPAGYMEDSDIDPRSGEGAWSEDVEFTLDETDDGWVLRVSADLDWLTDDERTYPVGVDPTAAWNYNASQDTYVQTGFNTSRHTETELKAGTYDGGSTRTASYLRFNSMVNELANHEIFGAELHLFNHWSYSCTPSPVHVHEVTQAWDQRQISDFPGPDYDSSPLGSASFARGWMPAGASSSDCPAGYEGIDLGDDGRDLVQAWVDGDKPNHGISVRASETDSQGWKRFGSRESWGAPYMTVTYSPYRAEYGFADDQPELDPDPLPNRGTSVDVEVTNRGDQTWTPSNGFELSYQVFDEDDDRVYHIAPTTPMPENVATGETVTVETEIDPLPPGEWTLRFDMTHQAQSFRAWGVPMTANLNIEVPDLPPQLIDHSPRDGAQVTTLAPEFTAIGRNEDDWPSGDVEFWFNFCDGEYPDWECVDSGWQDESTWQLPEGHMEWGEQYWWSVWVGDGEQETDSGWLSLVAEPDQPAVTSNLANSGSEVDDHGAVDPLIGNYTQTVTDAVLPTAGPTLNLTRTYNSADPRRDGIFGAGWSTRFDMGLTPDVDGTGNVVVTYPDGRQHRFAREADDSFSAPSGMHAVLTETDDGWGLTDSSATTYAFDDTGRLLEVTDHRGRSQSISYDSSGDIEAVTADGGRSLEFTWEDDRVVALAAQGGDDSAEWTYAYEGQRLVEACDPEGDCTTYDYTGGSHYRAAVTDSNPHAYWRFDEESGDSAANEVPSSLGGEDAEIVGSALGADGALEGVDSGALDTGDGRYAELPEAVLHRVGSRITVEAWFSTTEQGTVIGALDDPDEPDERSQLVYVGNDGKLRAQFWTKDDTVDPITTDEEVNDGEWHHVALTSDGTTQTLYLDGAEVGTKEGQVEHRDTTYVYVGYGMGNSGWPETLPSLGDFPFEGSIDEVAVHQRPLHPDTVALHYASGAGAADRLQEVTTPEGNTAASLTHTESTSRVLSHTDRHGGQWAYSDRAYSGDVGDEDPSVSAEVTVTDPRGATSATRYDALSGYRKSVDVDQLGHETRYDYDVGGFLSGTTLPSGAERAFWNDEHGNRLGRMSCRDLEGDDCHWEWFSYYLDPDDPFDPRNNQLESHLDARSEDFLDETYRTWWAYNEHGDQISETTPATDEFPDGTTERHYYTDGSESAVGGGTVPAGLLEATVDPDGGETRYRYNEHGDTARVEEPSGLVTEYTHDGLGRVLTSTVVTDDRPDGVTTSYSYDAAGRVLTETGPEVGNELTGETHRERTSVLRDADGNKVRETISDLTGDEPDRVTMWAYNEYGHKVAETDPEGHTAYFGYDSTGARTHHEDASGTMFITTYTDRGHVAEEIVDRWTGHPDEDNEPAPYVLESNAYDPDGNLASTTDAAGRTTSFTYYADGELAQVAASDAIANDEDEPGEVVLEEHRYDPVGNPVRTVTGGGDTRTDMLWDEGSRLVSETLDPEGLDRTTEHTYDKRGNVVETALSDGSDRVERTRYTYDTGGHLVEEAVVVEDGALVTAYEVDESGRVTAVTDPRGGDNGDASGQTEPASADSGDSADFTSELRYDELGRLVEERLPEVEVERHGESAATERPTTVFGYDLLGNRTHEKDAEGHLTETGYDLVDQKVSSTAPAFTGADGEDVTPRASTEYDALGRVAEQTDALGHTRTYTYDQLGHLARVTDPPLEEGDEPGAWVFQRNALGELLTVEDPMGARTEATYDDLGHQVTETEIERIPDASAYTTQYAYDAAGNTLSVTDPLGNETVSSYNPAGELVEYVDPVGAVTTFAYDLAGREYEAVDPAGARMVSEFDLAGRTVRSSHLDEDGDELRTQHTRYDAADLPVERTDPLGHVVRTEFDALGSPVSVDEPVGDGESITTTFGYDANGQRTRITDGRGNSTHTTYTPTGHVHELIEPATDEHPDAADRTWTNYHDAAGNPVRQHAPGGVEREREYTALGEVTRESATGAAAETEDRYIGYDKLGRPSEFGTPDGLTEIVYDDRGNEVQFLGHDTSGQEQASAGTTFRYDGAGRMTSRMEMTGTATFDHDEAGRVTEYHDPVTGTDQVIEYTETGLPEVVTSDDEAVHTLDYDPLGQLVEDVLTTAGGDRTLSSTYTYDEAGQITERTTEGVSPSGTHEYAYDRASRLTEWTAPGGETTTYEWDDSGNRVGAGDTTFEFDERDRLVSSSEGDSWAYEPGGTVSSQQVDGQTRSPEFDGFERMVAAGDGDTEYAYDALGRMAERTAPDGEAHTFVYPDRGNNPVGVVDGSETPVAQYGRDAAGELVSVADSGQAPGLAYSNTRGDVVATYTETGSVIDSADFDPFGEAVDAESELSLGYQGEWTDPATGDVNMHARWYQPGSGRFASRDTATLEPTPSVQTNRYTYANANPVAHTDPSGNFVPLLAIPLAAGGGAVIGGGGAVAGGAAAGGAVTGGAAASWGAAAAGLAIGGGLAWGVASSGTSATGTAANTNTGVNTNTAANTGVATATAVGAGAAATATATAVAGGAAAPWTRPGNGGGGGGTAGQGSASGSATTVVVVDRRREILRDILNTPQPRPPITSLITRDELDDRTERLEEENAVERTVELDRDALYEEFKQEHIEPAGGPGSPSQNRQQDDDCTPRKDYGTIVDERHTGAVALYCGPEDLEGGSSARGRIKPPGWPEKNEMPVGKDWTYQRGHLIGKSLGGSGRDKNNLVTLYSQANNPGMFHYEEKVGEAVTDGQRVAYRVTPVYEDGRKSPEYIHMEAVGSGDLSVNKCVLNEQDYQYVPVSNCE